ncbi:hypothetical protein EJ05DRAFT_496095 [Pseudovirgaria hyperparasitica]|uniref:Uncharacterized protein n=1 Tax=Pseudovirgaria hyperparasitica TaxID=470096 RepID=A0A6A6WM27_9PEZI|nr:uncharacterized protein EJ05DRAFT_496095 [Pseudovirgaria hyperparasitica]KAF2763267.1 hypothetical protein EJ05DRAFT_496095 [Pseudovirgaria hyperparasitica]
MWKGADIFPLLILFLRFLLRSALVPNSPISIFGCPLCRRHHAWTVHVRRWIYWLQLAIYTGLLPVFYPFLRETCAATLLATGLSPFSDTPNLSITRCITERPGTSSQQAASTPPCRVDFLSISVALLVRLGIHYIVPAFTIACVGSGMASTPPTLPFVNDVADVYENHAATSLGAVLPFASPALFTQFGVPLDGRGSLLGFVDLVLGVAPVVLLVMGWEVCGRSLFMSQACVE